MSSRLEKDGTESLKGLDKSITDAGKTAQVLSEGERGLNGREAGVVRLSET